jgi:hypothetical protein
MKHFVRIIALLAACFVLPLAVALSLPSGVRAPVAASANGDTITVRAQGHRLRQDGLARARRPGNQRVGHLRAAQAQHQRRPLLIRLRSELAV